MKLNLFLILLAIIFILTSCTTNMEINDFKLEEKVALKEHFMVNDTIYWATAYPIGTMPDTFQYVGNIEETRLETPSANWQSYAVPVGSKIYLDPKIPYQAWIDGKYRYATLDALKDYIRYDDELYVYLGSVQGYENDYYESYREIWDLRVAFVQLSNKSRYLGKTIFEGYDMFPTQELGSNSCTASEDVYQYTEDTNILFAVASESAAVYVKAVK